MQEEKDARQRLERLIHTHSGMLYRHCYVLLAHPQDAQDTVQDTFLQYLKKRPALRDEDHERAWLLTVATNLCRNRHRHRSRHPQVGLEAVAEQSAPTEDTALLQAVAALPPKYARVLVLHYIHGYKVGEVAAMLRLTPSAVKMRLQKGRQLLKEEVREDPL